MTKTILPRPLALSMFALVGAAVPATGQQGLFTGGPAPMEIRTISEPAAVQRGDSTFVIYEIEIANPTSATFVVESLEVSGPTGRQVRRYEGDGWGVIVRRIPDQSYVTEEDFQGGIDMMPGARVLLYLWMDLEGARSAPAALSHRFTVRWTADDEVERHVQPGPVLDVHRDPIVIDAPVRGGFWRVNNGYASVTDHRRFFIARGQLFIPQRFGADYVKLAPDGLNAREGELVNEIFHAFGEPLYAVAAGRVVSVVDHLPDIPPGSSATGLAFEEMPGNHVILELAEGVYAAYVHLSGGDISVRPGQRVARGDRIASIGNSGNTSSPHLHFQLMD
ncbi:MAG: M23 family metallopeptidase, partial [Gemmatimonadetes bacterium]|nr:M23 family metallopeptidase [Gemmatimonadota bacterium]